MSHTSLRVFADTVAVRPAFGEFGDRYTVVSTHEGEASVDVHPGADAVVQPAGMHPVDGVFVHHRDFATVRFGASRAMTTVYFTRDTVHHAIALRDALNDAIAFLNDGSINHV